MDWKIPKLGCSQKSTTNELNDKHVTARAAFVVGGLGAQIGRSRVVLWCYPLGEGVAHSS